MIMLSQRGIIVEKERNVVLKSVFRLGGEIDVVYNGKISGGFVLLCGWRHNMK
jgi:hypothetical protein